MILLSRDKTDLEELRELSDINARPKDPRITEWIVNLKVTKDLKQRISAFTAAMKIRKCY